ncbi:PD40 domain-containing protein [Streptomyces sp. MZ04]|uniref:TolB family protein n=1 Tax=Streptomyces sp. MZ04 TaxID=2559236 RepID=UPI0014330A05|nr:PD40 domain-containing protein [Streptomyces sp. MZ04]
MRTRSGAVIAAAIAFAFSGTAASAAPKPPWTERINVTADGAQTTDAPHGPAVSADGRYAAFSTARSLTGPDDTNNRDDVYVRDLRRGTVERVGLQDSGAEFADGTGAAQLSADGRYVLFAARLGTSQDGFIDRYYVRDRRTDRTETVSLSDDERPVHGDYAAQARMSADGRYIVFVSRLKEHGDQAEHTQYGVYVRDRGTGTTRLISKDPAPGQESLGYGVTGLEMSADGSRITYGYTQFRPGWDRQVYAYDRRRDATERLDVTPAGADIAMTVPTLSGNGRTMAFSSWSDGLVPGDTNGQSDVFLRAVRGGALERISLNARGEQPEFESLNPRISADGRHVVFHSWDTHLVEGETARGTLFIRDLRTRTNQRVTMAHDGGESDWLDLPTAEPSADGGTVVFVSRAGNLVPDDTNGWWDAFVRHLDTRARP